MIIGNGLIARAFLKYKDDNNILIFASGVSNSKEVDSSQYEREEKLLKETIVENINKKFVYLSTTSIYDKELSDGLYCKHKLKMEDIIMKSSGRYNIFRLSEVVGSTTNTSQILSFLVNSIKNNEVVNIWKNATRHLIDIEDVEKICSEIMYDKRQENKIFNIASPIKSKILDLVIKIEKTFEKKANYRLVDKGSDYNINTDCIDIYLKKLNIQFNDKYVEMLISKYYKG